jgi:hypothetical protein
VRGTFALFIATLIMIATGLVVFSALGIVRNSDDPAAGAAATAFGRALRQQDGKRACALLSADTQSRIEQERKKPCDKGIVEVASDIEPDGAVNRISVAESSGLVTTADGSAFFLDKTNAGWKLSAAGCKRQAGDAPYSCALEA